MSDLNLDGLDLSSVSNLDDASEALKELSLEEEAMKVLTDLAMQNDLNDDIDLIREIYQEAVKSIENDQGTSDASTFGRKIYERIQADVVQDQGDQL